MLPEMWLTNPDNTSFWAIEFMVDGFDMTSCIIEFVTGRNDIFFAERRFFHENISRNDQFWIKCITKMVSI